MAIGYGYASLIAPPQLDPPTPEAQTAEIEAYARSNGIEIPEIFRDGAGGGMKDRSGLFELIEALRRDRAKLVVVERLAALAQEVTEQKPLVGTSEARASLSSRSASPACFRENRRGNCCAGSATRRPNSAGSCS